MLAWGGVPGVLQGRKGEAGSRMGSVVVHLRWTMEGEASWGGWSSKGA